jgi:hypothetical protein
VFRAKHFFYAAKLVFIFDKTYEFRKFIFLGDLIPFNHLDIMIRYAGLRLSTNTFTLLTIKVDAHTTPGSDMI